MLRPAHTCIAVIASVATLAVPLASGAFAASYGEHADKFPPSIIAMNQKPKSGDVTITYANVPEKSTLAIFASDANGKMGTTRVGQTSLDAGDHRDFRVQLKPMPKNGARLWAVLEGPDGKPLKNQRSNADRSFKVL